MNSPTIGNPATMMRPSGDLQGRTALSVAAVRAAETEAGEPVIRCTRPDGAQVTVEEPRGASTENTAPTKQDVCDAWQKVSDLYRTRTLINSRGPAGGLEAVAELGDLATRYPDEAVQFEGTYLAELAANGSVSISAFTSQQNLKAFCRA